MNVEVQENSPNKTCNDSSDNDTDDEWCEAGQRPSGVMDTLLQEPDIIQGGDRIISFAPGEGNRPLGLFIDKNSEHVKPITVKDLYLFTRVQFVNGNCEVKIDELHSLFQTYFTN